MAVAIFFTSYTASLKDDGTINAGGNILFYQPGTTTGKNVYAEASLSTSLGYNPDLDSAGRKTIFLDGDYDIVIRDSNDATIKSLSSINPSTTGSVTAIVNNTSLTSLHDGNYIEASGTITLTLSDAATLTSGWHVWVRNNNTSDNITIARQTSSDTFNGSASNYTLRPKEALHIYVNAAGNGFYTATIALSDNLTLSGDLTLSGGITSTGSVSMSGNVNLSGEIDINGSELKAGQIIVSNAAATGLTAWVPNGYLYGLILSNNVSDGTNDIDISAGECTDTTKTSILKLTSGITKQLDAAWAVGSAAGGLDQGSIANATYHVHAIMRPDTGVVDAIFSLSHDRRMTATMTVASPAVVTAGTTGNGHGLVAGSPIKFETTGALPTGVSAGTQYYVISAGLTETTFQFSTTNGGAAVNTSGSQSGTHTLVPGPQLPTNYTLFRRIGSIIRSGATILAFNQYGNDFMLDTSVLDVNATAPGTSAVTRTLTVPVGIKAKAYMNVNVQANAGLTNFIGVYLSSLENTDSAPSASVAPLATVGGYSASEASVHSVTGTAAVWTNNSAQIRSRLINSTSNDLRIATLGWMDNRGKYE